MLIIGSDYHPSFQRNQCDRTVSRTMYLEEDTQRRASTKSFGRVEEEERPVAKRQVVVTERSAKGR